MTTGLYKKGMVLVIMGLFIGAGVIPNISSIGLNLNDNNGKKNEIIFPIECKRIIHGDYYNCQQELVKYLRIKNKVTNYDDDIIDQHQDDIMNSGTGTCSPAKFAQSFKPRLNNLTRVEVPACRDDYDISGDIIISIHESLYGEALTSASILAEDVNICDPEYSPEWYMFDFPDSDVIPEKTYYIFWTPEQEAHESWVFWWGTENSSDPYSRGESWFNDTLTWEELSFSDMYPDDYYDFCFRTYGYSSNLEVRILGGFRVSADINNNGTATAYDVPWSIDLEGGLILAGEHTEGVIDELAPGATKTIRQMTLYGIGMTTITVTVGDTTKQATAFILGPLVLGVN